MTVAHDRDESAFWTVSYRRVGNSRGLYCVKRDGEVVALCDTVRKVALALSAPESSVRLACREARRTSRLTTLNRVDANKLAR